MYFRNYYLKMENIYNVDINSYFVPLNSIRPLSSFWAKISSSSLEDSTNR